MAAADINEFLSSPLVTWVMSCLEDPNSLVDYDDLVDGALVHSVFLQIDPEHFDDGVVQSGGDPVIRTKNLDIIIGNIKQFYEEELGHLVLILPDSEKLGRETESSIGEMKLLLLLLLGCAVQCPNKEMFITKIKDMAVDAQLAIVDCIKQVTDHQNIVITQDSLESINMGDLFNNIKKLAQERDIYREKWRGAAINEIADKNDSVTSVEVEEMKNVQQANSLVRSGRQDNHHHAVELADWKSKVRKQRQELEEKTEALLQYKEDLEHHKTLLAKLRQESQELMHEARTAKSYRDELDAVIERAERADMLEMEVARYREKLIDIEFYKARMEELREDNRVLIETREMLEEQLTASRRRADKVLELEAEIIKYKQLLNDIALERTADKEKFYEVCEENSELQRLRKAVLHEASLSASISDFEEPVSADTSLSEQLTNNAQTRALKLELENRRLNTMIDSLKEHSFHETSNTFLELEKDKKKLSLKIESLNDNYERLGQQHADSEVICEQALEENKQLQNSLRSLRASFNKQQQDYQVQQKKILDLEKNYDSVVKEKRRVQSLLESAQRRADDLKRSVEMSNQRVEELKVIESKVNDMTTRCTELDAKVVTLERQKEVALRDVDKYRETLEERDVALDKAVNNIEVLKRRIVQLEQEVDNSASQISRLQEMERSSKELDFRAAIVRETLEALKSDLVMEKQNTQQISTALEKLGLSVSMLLSLSLDSIVESIAKVPEVITYVQKTVAIKSSCCDYSRAGSDKAIENSSLYGTGNSFELENKKLQAKITVTQSTSENLLSENVKLQVHVTTLQSQNTSLASQHAALQQENSQLVASMENLFKERCTQHRAHAQLLRDQATLQALHEQLNNEYENLLKEREVLKAILRDSKNDARLSRELCESLETKNKTLHSEMETFVNNSKSLNNLRGEHTKLKDDFRNLFTATEKLRSEYRNLQEDYRRNRIEFNRLSLKQTEMQGKLAVKDERYSILELQISKLDQRCEMLLQMNTGLEQDRRSLMDHISLLFNQYHELLTHSLDDKEHYHQEEKIYTDKVNDLYRQKEKLEEKIMEHYRKLESCSTKKKSFGASLVRKVRKAGSELLNKSRSSSTDFTKEPEGKTYETTGNDSDASVEDVHQPREHYSAVGAGLEADSLPLNHPGTGETIYYADDAPTAVADITNGRLCEPLQLLEGEEDPTPSNPNPELEGQNNKPFSLIYNKVSAVINESRRIPLVKPDVIAQNKPILEEREEDGTTANSVWYEYGCV